MDSLIKADIFFVISSVATMVLAILLAILLFYFIKAARNLSLLSEKLKDGLKESEDFVVELKERLEDNLIFRLFFPPRRRRRSKVNEDSGKHNH